MAGPFLPHSTTYDFDDLPSALLGRWQIGGNVSGTAHIDYDDSGYWRIVGIMVDGMSPATQAEVDFAAGKCLPYSSWKSTSGLPLPERDPLYGIIVAMLTTDQYRERRNIDDHIAELIADMRASAADNRADRVVRLNRETV